MRAPSAAPCYGARARGRGTGSPGADPARESTRAARVPRRSPPVRARGTFPTRMPVLLLFAATVSGVAALVAEVVWFRALGRGVGTSAEALAVVSASFLGGLGIGAAIAGRRAPTTPFPFRAAAVCEAIAGVLVFLSPAVVGLVPDAHLLVLHLLGAAPGPSAWPAALVAGPVLLLPTAFLGATLPFLVRSRLLDVQHAGRWTGWLYGVNTLGAAGGVVVAVFLLLPALGETTTLRIAGAGNLLASLLILLAERPGLELIAPAPMPGRPAGRAPAPVLPEDPLGANPRHARFALFWTGVLALGGEVTWFRFLEPIAGVHLFGFALLLGAVLAGTALGGGLGGVLADRVRRPDLALSTALALGAVLLVASVAIAGAVPWVASSSSSRAAAAAAAAMEVEDVGVVTVSVKLLGAAICIVPPLVAFAAAYPLAVRALARTPAVASGAAGSLYAWNTVGNVVGSVLAGFFLLPRLGGPATLVLLGGLGLAFAAALRLLAARPRSLIAVAVPLVPLALLAVPASREVVLASGPRLPEIVLLGQVSPSEFTIRSRGDVAALAELSAGTYPRPFGRVDLPPIEPREGLVSTVGLLDERGVVRLKQGGLSESKFAPDDPDQGSETEVALALIPWLVHPAPKSALVIGHGAGWTCETLLASDLERIDVAELESAVLDVTEAYRGPLEVRRPDPRVRLRLADGRLLLGEAASKGGEYDLVVSQPSHPWVPGAGHLFTADAYALARRALRPGGVFAQWINLFDSNLDLLKSSVASFLKAFPKAWLFKYHDEVILVGFAGAPQVDAARVEKAWAPSRLERRITAAGLRGPEDVWKRFAADGPGLARLAGPDAPPATDDDPRIELGCAWVRFTGSRTKKQRQETEDALAAAFPPDLKIAWPDPAARTRWTSAVVQRLVDDEALDDARRWDERVSMAPSPAANRARARLAVADAKRQPALADRLLSRAVDLLRAAVETSGDDAGPAVGLLDVLLRRDRVDEIVKVGADLAQRFPDDGRVLVAWARGLVSSGDATRAEEQFRRGFA